MLDRLIDTMNQQVRFYEGQLVTLRPGQPGHDRERLTELYTWICRLRDVLRYLEEQQKLSGPLLKSLDDISDLPEELIQELSIIRTDELEERILDVIRACDGAADLDQVLVGLYRRFQIVRTRRFIQNKLYRMLRKGLLHSVDERKGGYCVERPKREAPRRAEAELRV